MPETRRDLAREAAVNGTQAALIHGGVGGRQLDRQ